MKKRHKPLVIGNWKMNPDTIGLARKLFLTVRKGAGRYKNDVNVVVAPPFPYISEMERLSPSKRVDLAAQDIFYETKGAYTGEVSLPMLKSVGVSFAIIGHSERRALGESDEEIEKDVLATLKQKVVPILCVGEQKRDSHGHHFSFVENQLHSALGKVPKTKLKAVVVAYEPIWAIGTGDTATPEDVHEMKLFIRKVLADLFGRNHAELVPILYGGSVNKKNTKELLERSNVDGFLVGGASLRGDEFVEIVKLTAHHAKHGQK